MNENGFQNKKQQTLLEHFFAEEKIWYPDYYLLCVVGGIVFVLTMFLYIMPFQIWEGDYTPLLTMLCMELIGVETYLGRYCGFKAEGKIRDVYEVLRQLPVSRRQLKIYRVRKLLKLCLKMTGTAVICQIAFAGVFMHTFSVGNILMPAVCCFLMPMVIVGGYLWKR